MHRRHCSKLTPIYNTYKIVLKGFVLIVVWHQFNSVNAQDSQQLLPVLKQIAADNQTNSLASFYFEQLNLPSYSDRRAGSKGLTSSLDFVAAQLTAMGYQLTYHQEPMPEWQNLVTELEIVPYKSDHFVPVKAVSIPWSVLKSDTSIMLTDVGTGTEEDFALKATEIKGKMVVIESPLARANNLPISAMTDLVERAIRFQAKGVLFISRTEENTYAYGNAAIPGSLAKIPVISISAESGLELRDWMAESKLLAFLHIRNRQSESVVQSVIAKLPGNSESSIVLETNMEAIAPKSAGAVAYTTSSLLEVARLVKSLNLNYKHTISFAFRAKSMLTTEQQSSYLKWVGNAKYALVTQGPGKLKRLQSPARVSGAKWLTALNPIVEEADKELNYFSDTELNEQIAGMHYLQVGYPLVIAQAENTAVVLSNLHTSADTPEKYAVADINSNARLLAMLSIALAQGTELPEEPIKPRKLKRWLKRNGIMATSTK
jgi:hypothetical protein